MRFRLPVSNVRQAVFVTLVFALPALARGAPTVELGCASLPAPQEEKKLREEAKKECPVLHTQLRGHEGAAEAGETCVRAHISVLGARREVCSAISLAQGSALAVPKTSGTAEDQSLKLLKDSALSVHKAELRTEDVRVLLKLRVKELEKAHEKLKSALARQKNQAATVKTAVGNSTSLAGQYENGIREIDRTRTKVNRFLEYATTAKEEFRQTHQALVARIPGSEADKLRLTTVTQATQMDAPEVEGKPADDAKYLKDRATGTAIAQGTKLAGVESTTGRAAAANTAGAVVKAVTGDAGAATSAAAQILTGTGKDTAVGGVQTALKAVPVVGGVAATGIGAGVTVLTTPTPVNEPEVVIEQVQKQVNSQGITYDNGVAGEKPLSYPESVRLKKLRDQYGGSAD